MTMDPRLLERRRDVAEENAHRSIGRLLRVLILVLVLGGAFWLAMSPWFSVARVRTAGIVSSNAHASLAEHDVVAGTPMIMLRTGDVVSALEADPWIVEARVDRDWPDEVVVRVIERVPVIWVQSAEDWSWRANDGVAVPGPDGPDEMSPRLIATAMPESDLEGSLLVKGAAEFVVNLPDPLRLGLTLVEDQGELWAEVEGFGIRLGRPVEMEAKALSLTALLREDLPVGSALILVAPTNPAVDLPETPGSGQDSAGESAESEGAGDG